jgi:hypothetical protein
VCSPPRQVKAPRASLHCTNEEKYRVYATGRLAYATANGKTLRSRYCPISL